MHGSEEKISFRLIKDSERDALFSWRNQKRERVDPGIGPYSEEDQIKHFERVKDRLFVALLDNEIIGTMLLQNTGKFLHLAWMIAPKHQSKGLCWRMVKAAACTFPGIKVAKIAKDNVASIKCAQKAGYKYVTQDEEFITYEWLD